MRRQFKNIRKFYKFQKLIQMQLFQCHREERSDVAISLIHLKRLPRPFRARNDIVKIYIAFILDIFFCLTCLSSYAGLQNRAGLARQVNLAFIRSK